MRKLEAYAGTPLYSYAIVLCILGFQGRGEGGGVVAGPGIGIGTSSV